MELDEPLQEPSDVNDAVMSNLVDNSLWEEREEQNQYKLYAHAEGTLKSIKKATGARSLIIRVYVHNMKCRRLKKADESQTLTTRHIATLLEKVVTNATVILEQDTRHELPFRLKLSSHFNKKIFERMYKQRRKVQKENVCKKITALSKRKP